MHIQCIGKTAENFEVLIHLGSRTYKCPTLVEAVSVVFKIGSLLNKRFPVSTKPVWQFFSEVVYDTPPKQLYQKVRSLVKKVERVVKAPKTKSKKRKPVTLKEYSAKAKKSKA